MQWKKEQKSGVDSATKRRRRTKKMIQRSIVCEGFVGMVENRPLMRCIVTFNYSEMKYFPNVWKSNGLRWTIFRFYNINCKFNTQLYMRIQMQPRLKSSPHALYATNRCIIIFIEDYFTQSQFQWHLYFSQLHFK